MNAVKVDEAHRIYIAALKPGDYYEPEIRGDNADEVTLRRLDSSKTKKSIQEVLKDIEQSPLRFLRSWDEIRKETREP